MRPARRNRRELPPGPNWIRGATSIRIDVPSVEIPGAAEDDGRATDEVPRSKLVSLSARFQGYHLGSPDSLPPIDEDAPPIPATLFRSSAEPPRRPHSPPPSRVAPVSDLDDAQSGELSTGLFESLDWDEAPPPKVERPERVLEPRLKREPVYVRNAILEHEQETLPPTATQAVVAARTDAFVREALAADWWVDGDADPDELDREWNGAPELLSELDVDPELDTAVGAAPPSALVAPPLSRVFPEPLALDDDELSLDPEPLDHAIHRAIDRVTAAQAREDARARAAELAELAEREAAAVSAGHGTAAIDIDERATPAAPEPRPERDAVVDWPPPMDRPVIDWPADWNPRTDDFGTLIVIQPRGVARAAALGEPWMVDLAAWSVGFLAMFFTGLVTTGSALLVLFALSLP